MPSLTYSDIENFSQFKTEIFVETGTFQGETLNNMKLYFKKLFSIEINPIFASNCKQKFINDTHVTILEGDSSEMLYSICEQLVEPTLFWLDGHWSGGNTGRGKKDCPLLEELNIIMNSCKQKCIVVIDDVRLFGTRMNEDWSDISTEKVINILKNRTLDVSYYPSYLHPKDRMIITLSSLDV